MASGNSSDSLFDARHALLLRIWHGLFFTLVLSTIVVVLMATQLFDTRANAPGVVAEAAERGLELTEKQGRGIAHMFEEKLWPIHIWIGYGITFLLLTRIALEFVLSREQRWWWRLKQALRLAPATDAQRKDRLHFIIVRWAYLVFYVLIFAMACTGLGLVYEDVPFFESIHRPLKEVHEILQYGIYTYVVAHLVGVVWADFTRNKGIISGMIGGGK